MKHPYEKYIKLEIVTMLGALFFTFLMFIYKNLVIFLFALSLLALSMLSEAALLFFLNKKVEAIKQAVRSILLLLLLLALIFSSLSPL